MSEGKAGRGDKARVPVSVFLLACGAYPWTYQVTCQSLSFPFCKIRMEIIILASAHQYIHSTHMRLYQAGQGPNCQQHQELKFTTQPSPGPVPQLYWFSECGPWTSRSSVS